MFESQTQKKTLKEFQRNIENIERIPEREHQMFYTGAKTENVYCIRHQCSKG